MMREHVTFAQFDAVLAELGFQKKVVPGAHVNYYHATLDSPLMIRLHKPKDIVPGYVLLATRRELDNFGVIAVDKFDDLLESAAA